MRSAVNFKGKRKYMTSREVRSFLRMFEWADIVFHNADRGCPMRVVLVSTKPRQKQISLHLREAPP
jgi:hypothetical protein